MITVGMMDGDGLIPITVSFCSQSVVQAHWEDKYQPLCQTQTSQLQILSRIRQYHEISIQAPDRSGSQTADLLCPLQLCHNQTHMSEQTAL